MTINEVRQRYLDFFTQRGHTIIASSSLVPENDPTTLFTGSGMQPLLPYLLGSPHPSGTRLVDSQKCFRAEDIEEVGDNRHTTFFEMLGNWSLGEYFKTEQLEWFFTFLTDTKDDGGLGLDPSRIYVTVFSGDANADIPPDNDSVAIWQDLFARRDIEAKAITFGSEAEGARLGMGDGRIFGYGARKNWWSRAGIPENMPAGEPGGPDSEVFFDFDPSGEMHDPRFGKHCHPNCDCGRFMEIGNSVFMEYIKQEDGSFAQLPQKNVDFGGGLERITAAANNDADVFNVEGLARIIEEIEQVTGKRYAENAEAFRIIADHMRSAVFMIADGVHPSNTEQGYFVRRLIRRSALKARTLSHPEFFALGFTAHAIAEAYGATYPVLKKKEKEIDAIITEEETRFRQTLEAGLKEFGKVKRTGGSVSGAQATTLFTTHGFPIELTVELAEKEGVAVDLPGFEREMEKHRELSRAGAEQKFKGGLADSSEKTTQLHSVTHLLLAGLRKYLGEDVHQAGSNITAERTRFDFTYPQKVERETLDKVERYVNDAIAAGADRTIEEMPKEEARAAGVEGSFWERYPDTVHVYTFKSDDGTTWSRELCGGPHVQNTSDISGTFRIAKEEASSAGVRRIRGVLE